MTQRWALGFLWVTLLAACSDDGTSSEGNASGAAGASFGRAGAATTGGTTASSGGGTASGGVTSTGGVVTSGGATASGGVATSGGTSTTFDPAMTAGCSPWPTNRLAPWVGAFFYGPHPGPCGETYTAPDGRTSQSSFSYDGQGRVTTLEEETATYQYVYSGDRIEKVLLRGSDFGLYAYSATSVTYVAGGPSNYSATWQLDTLGYPRRLIVDYLTTAIAPDIIYRYEYQGCRLVQRKVERVSAVSQAYDWQYGYDAQGHLVTVTSADGMTLQEDYSCWP